MSTEILSPDIKIYYVEIRSDRVRLDRCLYVQTCGCVGRSKERDLQYVWY